MVETQAWQRKHKGSGSFYRRSRDGRWVGAIDAASADGRRRRKTVTGSLYCRTLRKFSQLVPYEKSPEITPRLKRLHMAQAMGRHTMSEWFTYGRSVNWTCEYCGTHLGYERSTKDHRLPLARGGSDAIHNLAVACRPCNSCKNAKTESEFRDHLARYPGVVGVLRVRAAGIAL